MSERLRTEQTSFQKEAKDASLADISMVSFDVWLTLIKSNPLFKPSRAHAIANYLDYKGDVEELGTVIRRIDKQMDAQSDASGVQYGFEARVEAVADEVKDQASPLTEKALQSLEQEVAQLMVEHPPLLLDDDLPYILKQLKERGRLAIVSNTGFIDGKYMRLALDTRGVWEHIDVGIFSDEVGVAKPNPKIFQILAERAQLEPGNILHIGDNYVADYQGARNAGLQSRHLSQDETIRSEKIASIRELLSLLK